MSKCLSENNPIINLLSPQADGSLTSAVISFKNVNRARIVVLMNQTEANQCTITLMQATDIAAATNKAVSNVVPIWYNSDTAASDAMTKTTSAKTYQFSATHDKIKKVEFEIDPANAFDAANSYDCFYLTSGGSNVANIICAFAELEMKYKEDVLPSVIVD